MSQFQQIEQSLEALQFQQFEQSLRRTEVMGGFLRLLLSNEELVVMEWFHERASGVGYHQTHQTFSSSHIPRRPATSTGHCSGVPPILHFNSQLRECFIEACFCSSVLWDTPEIAYRVKMPERMIISTAGNSKSSRLVSCSSRSFQEE